MPNDYALSWAENIYEHEEPPEDRFTDEPEIEESEDEDEQG